jgi:glycosyltransferase involved in cell wall biosynthesis
VKVALVTRRYPPLIGGAERVLSYLAPALAEAGAEVTVITSSTPDPSNIQPPSSIVPIIHLPTSRLRFLGTALYMRSLRNWLLAHRPDLIYVSMLKHDAYVAIGVGKKLGIPVVLRPEGAGETGDLAWQTWGRFGRKIGKRCKRADAFVAISSGVHGELVRGGYDEAKIHDIPNGVPVPDSPWVPWSKAPHTSPRIVFVGRLAPEKNLATLIDAWPIVLKANPGARLMLIGDGPERPALEARAKGLGLPKALVTFAGASDDPASLVRGSDLFVLPSREEGMSIALLEAMALGIPIIASDIPGNRRLITDGTHGRLAPPDDATALACAILAQWVDPQTALKMAGEARRRVIEKYSIEAVARRHLDLFQGLIREKAE